MSYKRSRSTFEADLHAPYALFGTPLPDENDARDDGSYLPLWKQDVRDEKGRRRLHGAFTGGWSAGYFNTVGSKEGWTPSTFVSSRSNRRKDDAASASIQQRAEEYMDEEDLADAVEAQQLQTSQAFAGLGSSTQDEMRTGGLMGLFKSSGDTRGLQLLRRMGWKDGQGIGPKIRRGARLDVKNNAESNDKMYLFAPDDAEMIHFVRKTDRMGLGHRGGTKLQSLGKAADSDHDDDDDDDMQGKTGRLSLFSAAKKKEKGGRGAFGVGVLNDTGSDEEDPYDMGPKIRYNRTMGGDKKKKKKATAAVNPSLKKAPVFLPKTARAGISLRRCHDGRLPLDGFVLAKVVEDLAALSQYAPPPIPEGWKSSKDPFATADSSNYTSTADAAKASTLDPRSRAALLGEKALPGKSIFDFISSSARDKLAAASGNKSLPPGLGELPEGHSPLSEDEKRQALWDRVPKLDQSTAAAALSRSSGGPYADDEAKRGRYRKYLMSQANPGQDLPDKTPRTFDDDYIREMNEFYNCARIFKPMTGFMASRFTTSKTVLNPSQNSGNGSEEKSNTDLLSKPEPKSANPAEEAAKMGMFGHMTRSVEDFYPTRLLCKRFNVRAPAHVRPDYEVEKNASASNTADTWKMPTQWPMPDPHTPASASLALEASIKAPESHETAAPVQQPVEVNPEKNDAVEGKVANADVLKAIFGDSDSE